MAMRKKTVLAMLMCAVFVAVFAAPLVQSEAGVVHTIAKNEPGPPSDSAVVWYMHPDVDGTWYGHVINYGMRWLIIDMVDLGSGDILVDRVMYRFAEYGDVFDTDPVEMVGGCAYMITGTPNGALGTYVTVEDVFEAVQVPDEDPIAAFTYTVDGDTVTVDASGSYDPDGGQIVSWSWEWGDGATDTGVTAEHTYAVPESVVESAPIVEDDIPDPPFIVCGYTYSDDGVTKLPDCAVTITNTNVTSGWSIVVSSGVASFYSLDISPVELGYTIGDTILVEAVKGDYVGENEGVIAGGSYMRLDITLTAEVPEPDPYQFTIWLTVMDDEGATDTVFAKVTVYI